MRTKIHIVLFLILFIYLSTSSSANHHHHKKKQYKPCKRMVVFFHNILYNGHNKANATSAIVAFPEGANRTVLADDAHFGDIIVFDDPITTGEKLQSPLVGRAQGMYVYDTKTPSAAFFAFTFRVNSTQHQGTINVMGADPVKDKTRDLVITGGTGDFFMHRGIATMSSVTHEGDVYFSARFDIKFYECW